MLKLGGNQEDREILQFIWERVAQNFRWILFSFLFAACGALVQVSTAALVKKLLDEAFLPKDLSKLTLFCFAIVALFLFDGATDFAHRFCLRTAAERTIRTIRRELFDRFLVRSAEATQSSSSGQAVTHVISDTTVIGLGLHVVADLLKEPLTLLALIGYILWLNWHLAAVCVLGLPLIGLIGKTLGRSARRNQSRIQHSIDKITSHISETLGGLRTAHSFGQTPMLREEFKGQVDTAYGYLMRLARVEEAVGPLTKWFGSWVGAGLLFAGGWFVIRGDMTHGEIVSFMTAAGLLQQPLRQLNTVNVRLQQVIAAGKRIRDTLNIPLDPIGESQQKLLTTGTVNYFVPDVPPVLEFHDVYYRYPADSNGQSRDYALKNISFQILPGSKVAMVGRSGSGKSTLSLLAMRFLDPTSGSITMGKKAAHLWNLGEYRAHFGYVSQDVFLFDRSLRDNLKFANSNATDAEILAACEKASVTDLIHKLPGGLDSRLGERAGLLSGGERQRLAIARAFLKNAPLLVLDEATSQLDSLSEAAVQSALTELMRGRTTLIIAHRLSTIKNCDSVLVFEEGQIIERGIPSELMSKQDGKFAQLWAAQK
jgi:subfamily B ATP-binding cassette protein MsbA